VLQALEKLPADRFASAAEFGAALHDPGYAKTTPAPSRVPSRAHAGRWLPWALLLATWGGIAFGLLRPKGTVSAPPVYRFDVVLPDNAAWVGDIFSVLTLSPDGTTLVYNGQDSTGQRRLYRRAMNQLEPTPIPGSENGAAPFFSPDGKWIGFRLGTRLVKAAVGGSAPETICEAGGLVRATWLERNVVVFADREGLRQCSMSGQLTTILPSTRGESYALAHGLPGDRGVLFGIEHDSTTALAVLDLQTHRMKRVNLAGGDPRYVATGHLVYLSPDGLVRAVRFNLRKLSAEGEPVVLESDARVELGGAVMAISRTGTIVTPAAAPQRAVELVDRSGRAEALLSQHGEFGDPSISPDGRRVALRRGRDIWLLDRSQGALTRLSFESYASRPTWSPDGRQISYVRQVGTHLALRLQAADGSTPAESLLDLPNLEIWEGLFTRDGRSLIVRTVGGRGSRDVWLAPRDSGAPVHLLGSPADEVAPAISPDGRWMAYVSNESGRAEVYVRSFPGMGGRYQVSVDGGTEPAWSPRGDELFYRNGPALIAAQVQTGSGVEVVRRSTLLSEPAYVTDLTHRVYDVMPDGRHFVFIRNLAGVNHLTVTLNRFQNLRP
jgi:Tol biopolymer transport system component